MAHIAFFFGLGAMVFGVIAEVVFWDEFQVRFNFIAVDYLVYTTEVLDNIWEFYPMPFILMGLVAATAVIYALILRASWVNLWLKHANESWPQRYRAGGLIGCFGVRAKPTFQRIFHDT